MKRIFTHLAILASLLTLSTTAMAQDSGEATSEASRNEVFRFRVIGYKSLTDPVSFPETTISEKDKNSSNEVPVTMSFFDDMSMLVTLPNPNDNADQLNGMACTPSLLFKGNYVEKDLPVYLPTVQNLHLWLSAVYGGARGNSLMYGKSFSGETCPEFPGAQLSVNVFERVPKASNPYALEVKNKYNFDYNITSLQKELNGSSQYNIQGRVVNSDDARKAWDAVKSHFRFDDASGMDHNIIKKGAYVSFMDEKLSALKDIDLDDQIDYFVNQQNYKWKAVAGKDYTYSYSEPFSYKLQFFFPAGSTLVIGSKKLTVLHDFTFQADFSNKDSKALIDRVKKLTNSDERYPISSSLNAIINYKVGQGTETDIQMANYPLARNFLSYFNGIIDIGAQANKSQKKIPVWFVFDDWANTATFGGNNDNANDNTTNLPEADDMVKIANVTFSRKMLADGGWYTLCVPFGIPADQLKANFGDDVKVRQFAKTVDGSNNSTFKFESTDMIQPGHPYLIQPSIDFEKGTFTNVPVINRDDPSKMSEDKNDNGYIFRGTKGFADEDIYKNYNGKVLFFGGTDGTELLRPTAGGGKLAATRCYIVEPTSPAALAKSVYVDIDGQTTGIEGISISKNDAAPASMKIYNISGQEVGNNLNNLPKGIYIVNGKKVLK